MKFQLKHVFCAAAFVAASGVHAAPATMTHDLAINEWRLVGDAGSLQFSSLLISALNTAKVSLAEVSPADLQVTTTSTTSSSGVVTTRYTGVNASAPITALTGDFDNQTYQFNVQQVSTAGGATQTTIKNGATDGPGYLSISNLKVDLLTKRVYADIDGGNGVGSIQGYHLWTYTALTGPTSLDLSAFVGDITVTNTLSGLFASTAAMDLIDQALNLNAIGRSSLNTVNDPTKGGGAGFGTIVSKIHVVAVPEPEAYAQLGVGLVGLGLASLARRRSPRARA